MTILFLMAFHLQCAKWVPTKEEFQKGTKVVVIIILLWCLITGKLSLDDLKTIIEIIIIL
jgi:hypothetical protein